MLSVMVTVIGRLAPLASVDRQVVVAPTRMGTCWGQVVVVLRPRLANCWLIARSPPPARTAAAAAMPSSDRVLIPPAPHGQPTGRGGGKPASGGGAGPGRRTGWPWSTIARSAAGARAGGRCRAGAGDIVRFGHARG